MSHRSRGILAVILTLMPSAAGAHTGPPFPIVRSQTHGAYRVSVWTDPDVTGDAQPGGRFWVQLRAAATGVAAPLETSVAIAATAAATGRQASPVIAAATGVDGTSDQWFAALLLPEEGPYDVRISIGGPLGSQVIHAGVDATYDLRPSPIAFAVYAAPFVAVGTLWVRLLVRRRAGDAA
jgi:hypothetical protein